MDIAFWSTVAIVSALGSLHCAGMCGPIAMLAAGSGAGTCGDACGRGRARRDAVLAYQAGRLGAYLLIGAVAGAAGAALDLGGDLIGWQRTTAWLAGVTLIAAGVLALARAAGLRLPQAKVPKVLTMFLAQVRRVSQGMGAKQRAALIGAVTGLLPCGWLYTFVVIAAGTGQPVAGAAVMGLLWLGAVPVLVSVAWGVSWVSGRWRSSATWVTAILVIVVGVSAVRSRSGVAFEPWLESLSQETLEVDAAKVKALTEELPPCCRAEEETP